MRVPTYRKHGSKNRALVEYQGKRHLLPGPYDSEQSRTAYRRFLTDIFREPTAAGGGRSNDVTIAEICAAFLRWSVDYYPTNANGNGEHQNFVGACRYLLTRHAADRAVDFGPIAFAGFQSWLTEQPIANRPDKTLSRNYCNVVCRRVRQVFKFAVRAELIAETTYRSLLTVPALSKGRATVRESTPRRPVSWETVRATLRECNNVVATMVRVQWVAGARSSNLVNMHTRELTRRDDGLIAWSPGQHKGTHRDQALTIYFGRRGCWLLDRWCAGRAPGYLFDPRDAPPYPGHEKRRKGPVYKPRNYAAAIREAAKRAGVEHWSPHQIRRTRADDVRDLYDLEGAQAALGHNTIDATQIYTARRDKLAQRIAADLG